MCSLSEMLSQHPQPFEGLTVWKQSSLFTAVCLWIVAKRVRLCVKASEMRIHHRLAEFTLQVEPLLFWKREEPAEMTQDTEGTTLVSPSWRCIRLVEDSGHAGEIMIHSWRGNIWGSPKSSWNQWVRTWLTFSSCSYHDPNLEKWKENEFVSSTVDPSFKVEWIWWFSFQNLWLFFFFIQIKTSCKWQTPGMHV